MFGPHTAGHRTATILFPCRSDISVGGYRVCGDKKRRTELYSFGISSRGDGATLTRRSSDMWRSSSLRLLKVDSSRRMLLSAVRRVWHRNTNTGRRIYTGGASTVSCRGLQQEATSLEKWQWSFNKDKAFINQSWLLINQFQVLIGEQTLVSAYTYIIVYY